MINSKELEVTSELIAKESGNAIKDVSLKLYRRKI